MVGIHQTAFGHDAVTIRVRITGKGQVEAVAHIEQATHDIRRRAVHPDLAVLVTGNKAECGVDDFVDHGQAQFVALGYGLPQGKAGSPQRIDPQGNTGSRDAVHIQDARQVFHIAGGKIIALHQRRPSGTAVRQAMDVTIEVIKIDIGLLFDPGGHRCFGRAAMRRIVFETTVSRRVVRRRDDDAVSQSLTAVLAVPAQDGMGDRRGRCGGTVVGDANLHIIGRQDFKRTAKGRFRQGMRISAHEQRTGDAVLFAVITDGLGDGVDVAFVEGLLQRRTTMPGRSKRHTLCGLMRIRRFRIVGTDERGDILQSLGRRQFAGMGMYCHDVSSCPFLSFTLSARKSRTKKKGA